MATRIPSRGEPDFYLESLDGTVRHGFVCPDNIVSVASADAVTLTAEVVTDGEARGYDAIDPQISLFHEESSWHRGAGQSFARRRGEDDYRHATSHGVIMFVEGVVSSGYDSRDVDFNRDGAALPTGEDAGWLAKPVIIGHELYASFGNLLMRWKPSESLDRFGQVLYEWSREATLSHPTKSLAVYGQRLVAAFGDDGYAYSDEGDYTTWADVSDVGADFLAVARNAAGDLSLAKVHDGGFSLTQTPETPGSWSASIDVGSEPLTFTSLTPANDTVYVGADRGLFAYDAENGSFVNIEPEAGILNDFDRYKVVMPRGGFLYATRGDESLWRIDDRGTSASYVDLRNLIQFPTYQNMSGIVEALAQDSSNIWVATRPGVIERGFPYTFPIDFSSLPEVVARVLVLREDGSAHVVFRAEMSRIDQMVRNISFRAAQHTHLLLLGVDMNDRPSCKLIEIPSDTETPINSAYKQCSASGYITTPWIDYFYPDVAKMLTEVSFQAHSVTTGADIKVEYRTDTDRGDDHAANWRPLAEFAPVNGINRFASLLEAKREFRRIRFRITMKTAGDNPFAITSFVAHAVFARPLLRTFTFNLTFGEDEDSTGDPSERADLEELIRSHPAHLVYFDPSERSLPSLAMPDGARRMVRIRGADDVFGTGPRPRPISTTVELLELEPE